MLLRMVNDLVYIGPGSTKFFLKRLFNITNELSEAKLEVERFFDACHKRFETRDQAEAFIENWKQSFADTYRTEIKKALD